MKKNNPAFNIISALSRKTEQRRTYSSLSIAKKLQMMDRLHDNAVVLRGFRQKTKAV
jgi:hypothetical protein